MTYKAAVFDMDGTLLNTLKDLTDSTNFALQSLGFPAHSEATYQQKIGTGLHELIRLALPEQARDANSIKETIKIYCAHYSENWNITTRPYDGIPELLTALTEQGFKLAILTNKAQHSASRCQEFFLSDWRWEMVQGQNDGVPPKPHVEMSNPVTQALNVAPETVLYLGDSDVDMYTAKNAGYVAVGVTWGFRSKDELQAAGADFLIDHPLELLKHF